MSLFFFGLALACLLGVVAALAFGLGALAGGKSEKSNKFMRLRILLQALTIAFLALAWLSR